MDCYAKSACIVGSYTDGREGGQLVQEVEGKTLDELSNSGENRFHQLDAMLVRALVQMKGLPEQLAMRAKRKENGAPQAQHMRGRTPDGSYGLR